MGAGICSRGSGFASQNGADTGRSICGFVPVARFPFGGGSCNWGGGAENGLWAIASAGRSSLVRDSLR